MFKGIALWATILVFGTACIKSVDAYFVNPCSEPLTISTHDYFVPSEENQVESVTLEPGSVTKIDGAFHGGGNWSVSIEGSDEIVRVNDEDWVHETVVIPEEVCDDLP